MRRKGTMDWISMHHLVGTRQDCRGEFSVLVRMSRSWTGRKTEANTPSAFGNGGRHERSITPCTILPCVSLFLFSCQAALSLWRVFSKLKDIRDAVGDRMLEDISEIRLLLQCNGDLDDYCDIFEGRKE
mmetsp:Transcript_23725/g.47137  ORF Transcript_23725/g.47137 Transcript_23725/m.47137 type:complete len:129 (-) Transcript_23725:28-414(-)